MPNKYQREIEEILRNMDLPEQGQSLGDRIRSFNRPSARAPRPRLQLRISGSGMLLVAGIALAMVAAGLVYYFARSANTALYANLAGVLGLIALGSILLGLIAGWVARFGGHSAPTWRGQADARPSSAGFAPFRPIASRWRMMRLRWRYWRNGEREQ